MPAPELPRDEDGQLTAYAWPGGYPLFYDVKDGGVLCVKCAREAEAEGLIKDPDDPQWYIVAADVNYESPDLYCDHCGERIPSAYAEPECDHDYQPTGRTTGDDKIVQCSKCGSTDLDPAPPSD